MNHGLVMAGALALGAAVVGCGSGGTITEVPVAGGAGSGTTAGSAPARGGPTSVAPTTTSGGSGGSSDLCKVANRVSSTLVSSESGKEATDAAIQAFRDLAKAAPERFRADLEELADGIETIAALPPEERKARAAELEASFDDERSRQFEDYVVAECGVAISNRTLYRPPGTILVSHMMPLDGNPETAEVIESIGRTDLAWANLVRGLNTEKDGDRVDIVIRLRAFKEFDTATAVTICKTAIAWGEARDRTLGGTGSTFTITVLDGQAEVVAEKGEHDSTCS